MTGDHPADGACDEAAPTGFADEVADCYSGDLPPSARLCDRGFALADRTDALAIEVLDRRRRAGVPTDASLPRPARAPAAETRHLARAHVVALARERAAHITESALTDLGPDPSAAGESPPEPE